MAVLQRRLVTPALIGLLGLVLLGPGLPMRAPRDPAPAEPAAVTRDLPPDADAEPAPLPATPTARTRVGPPDILIQGSGWGHSVGLSQYGARAMAMAGWDHRQILSHYFPGIRIGKLRNAPPPMRVGLFVDRQVDASRLLIQGTSRDGAMPTRAITVDMNGQVLSVPHGQTMTLTADAQEFVLRDGTGAEKARGIGPVRVLFNHTSGKATLLRLPQLGATYQWGILEVHRIGTQLSPVLIVNLEQYLRGIAEMPSDWHVEALRAQAVTARTYALRSLQRGVQSGCVCHLGTTPLHQVYGGWAKEAGASGARWTAAIDDTRNEVVSYQGKLAWTYFSSSHGGRSEDIEDSWAYPNEIAYLRGVDDSWSQRPEAENPYAQWQRLIKNRDFARALGVGLKEVRSVRVLSRTSGGTPRELEIIGIDSKGVVQTRTWSGTRKGIAGADLKLLFRAVLPSQQLETLGLAPFVDDDGLPAEEDIIVVYESGVMAPCDATARRFCPDRQVRRGEAVDWVRHASGSPVTLSQHDGGLTRAALAQLLQQAGAFDDAALLRVLGCQTQQCPPQVVTRAEMAGFLRRAFSLD